MRLSWLSKLFFASWLLYFSWFWANSFQVNENGDVFANHINIWGDWAAHFTMGSSMAFRQLWLAESPFLMGAKFSYPFAADFISGLLVKWQVPFLLAFIIPSWLGSLAIVAALFWLYKTWLGSEKLAILAALILLLGGGMGWWFWLADIKQAPNPIQAIVTPAHEYTRLDKEHIKWINVIDSMIIPQRAFTLGFPIGLVLWTLFISWLRNAANNKITSKNAASAKIPNWLPPVLAGLLLGQLPIIHMHTLLALAVLTSTAWICNVGISLRKKVKNHKQQVTWFSFWRQHWQNWLIMTAVALPCLIFWYLYLYSGHVNQQFISWYPGWLAKEFQLNWFYFWWLNWGVTPWLALLGTILICKKSVKGMRIYEIIPFWLLFAIANLWLFQPFSWDNTKLVIWAAVGFAALCALAISWLWQQGWQGRIVAIALAVATIFSGTLDAYWILRTDLHSYRMYSGEEVAAAAWVKNNTDTNALFVTGTNHNHWLFNLTGRQAVMTYPGWLWTHGYNYKDIEDDIATFILEPQQSDFGNKYKIDYVLLSKEQLESLPAASADWWQTQPLLYNTSREFLYKYNVD